MNKEAMSVQQTGSHLVRWMESFMAEYAVEVFIGVILLAYAFMVWLFVRQRLREQHEIVSPRTVVVVHRHIHEVRSTPAGVEERGLPPVLHHNHN